MLVVGLTGGIATGKSTVSSLLKASHVPIVDADVLAREVVAPGTSGLKAIVRAFGSDVLQLDGSLDRAKLGALVFADEAQRRKLNAIVHPAVRRAMLWDVLKHWVRGERMCVVDVPLLVESKLHRFVGKVVVVYCSPELQLQRLMARDKSTQEAASARIRAQLPIADKLAYADIVLDNSGPRGELEAQVSNLIQRLEREAGWAWRLDWWLPPVGLVSAVWTLFWRAMRRQRRLARKKK